MAIDDTKTTLYVITKKYRQWVGVINCLEYYNEEKKDYFSKVVSYLPPNDTLDYYTHTYHYDYITKALTETCPELKWKELIVYIKTILEKIGFLIIYDLTGREEEIL